MKKGLLYLVGGGAVIWLVSKLSSKITAVQSLSTRISNVQLGSFNFPNLTLKVNVEVTNPTPTSVEAKNFTGSVQSPSNENLGNFNIDFNNANGTGIIIPPNSQTILVVNVNANVINTAISVIQNGLKASITGVVTVSGFSLPVNTNVEITSNGVVMS